MATPLDILAAKAVVMGKREEAINVMMRTLEHANTCEVDSPCDSIYCKKVRELYFHRRQAIKSPHNSPQCVECTIFNRIIAGHRATCTRNGDCVVRVCNRHPSYPKRKEEDEL